MIVIQTPSTIVIQNGQDNITIFMEIINLDNLILYGPTTTMHKYQLKINYVVCLVPKKRKRKKLYSLPFGNDGSKVRHTILMLHLFKDDTTIYMD